MVALSLGKRIAQEGSGFSALAFPAGRIWYVDGNNGSNGNDGSAPRTAVATLAYAVASLAEAGDTIICAPGGSETLTSTIAVSVARLKIICPVQNPESGYTLTGAGTVDLITVSAADVHIEGLKFTRSAGAGSTTAGIVATAAGDRLTVRRCSFDYTDLTSSWTNYGVETTDGTEDVLVEECVFRDCHRGVLTSIATGTNAIGLRIVNCRFWVGQATAWGVYSDPTSTGTLSGLEIVGCTFIEADGDGTAATDVWDGTTGLDGASGPIYLGALLDRFLIQDCRAYSASEGSFGQLCNIVATSLGGLVGNLPDVGVMSGEADIDVSEDTYTAFVEVLNVAPRAGAPLEDLVIDIDVNKATNGFDTVATAADTLDLCCVAKADGTNYRGIGNAVQVTANGDGSLENNEDGARFQLGPVGQADISVRAKVSAERGDVELPYRIHFKGQFPPVLTAVAAA